MVLFFFFWGGGGGKNVHLVALWAAEHVAAGQIVLAQPGGGLGLLLAFDMSLGFNGPLYGALYQTFLPFHALRVPARMGIMVSFSLAVLTGYGATRIAGWIQSPSLRSVTLTIIGALMLIEYASKPLPLWPATAEASARFMPTSCGMSVTVRRRCCSSFPPARARIPITCTIRRFTGKHFPERLQRILAAVVPTSWSAAVREFPDGIAR